MATSLLSHQAGLSSLKGEQGRVLPPWTVELGLWGWQLLSLPLSCPLHFAPRSPSPSSQTH